MQSAGSPGYSAGLSPSEMGAYVRCGMGIRCEYKSGRKGPRAGAEKLGGEERMICPGAYGKPGSGHSPEPRSKTPWGTFLIEQPSLAVAV